MNTINPFRLAVLTACALALQTASADYFVRWQVENANFSYASAAVSVVGPGGVANLLPDAEVLRDYGVAVPYVEATSGTRSTQEAWAQFALPAGAEASDYLFSVRLFDADDALLAASDEVLSLAQLESAGFTSGDLKSPSPDVWTVSAFHAVPEPTSGLLMLVGIAGLALRRRRV